MRSGARLENQKPDELTSRNELVVFDRSEAEDDVVAKRSVDVLWD